MTLHRICVWDVVLALHLPWKKLLTRNATLSFHSVLLLLLLTIDYGLFILTLAKPKPVHQVYTSKGLSGYSVIYRFGKSSFHLFSFFHLPGAEEAFVCMTTNLFSVTITSHVGRSDKSINGFVFLPSLPLPSNVRHVMKNNSCNIS